MAAESNTPVDIEIWIEKVIKSCETVRHRINVEKLLDAYISRLREEGMPFYQTMHIDDKFQSLLWDVKEEIKNKQLPDEQK